MGNINRYTIIDEYMKSLYKGNKSEEVEELKEELREHLILSSDEFISKGYNEVESAKMAIEKFDGGESMMQELYSSLDRRKSILKCASKIFISVAVIGFLLSGIMWYYHDNLIKSRKDLTNEFNEEIKILAKKYDMININEYKMEIEKLLEEERFEKVKILRLSVADMEEGNTSLDSSNVNAKSVYDNTDIVGNTLISLFSYNTKDFLDSHGNIVNPQIFVEHFFYYGSSTVSSAAFVIGAASPICYIILKFKNK